MSEVKRYKKRLTRSQIELAQPRTEFVLAADYDALEAEHDQARRTAEYWKAEHLAGNQALDAALKQVDGLRELLADWNAHFTGPKVFGGPLSSLRERTETTLSAKP